MMRYAHHSVRLSPALNQALTKLAEQRGVSRYKVLSRAVETGLGAIAQPQPPSRERAELALALDELAKLTARLKWVEAMLDRTLFTASASYSYARHAALHGDRDPKATDANISAATDAAYARQKNLAKGSLK